MTTEYCIFLDDVKIGVTELEKADAPMGVVFGKIRFDDRKFNFDFLKGYCIANNIKFSEGADDKIINTTDIKGLNVRDHNNNIIKALSYSISGIDSEGFEIYIEGVAYPLYAMLFPHHVNDYNTKFK